MTSSTPKTSTDSENNMKSLSSSDLSSSLELSVATVCLNTDNMNPPSRSPGSSHAEKGESIDGLDRSHLVNSSACNQEDIVSKYAITPSDVVSTPLSTSIEISLVSNLNNVLSDNNSMDVDQNGKTDNAIHVSEKLNEHPVEVTILPLPSHLSIVDGESSHQVTVVSEISHQIGAIEVQTGLLDNQQKNNVVVNVQVPNTLDPTVHNDILSSSTNSTNVINITSTLLVNSPRDSTIFIANEGKDNEITSETNEIKCATSSSLNNNNSNSNLKLDNTSNKSMLTSAQQQEYREVSDSILNIGGKRTPRGGSSSMSRGGRRGGRVTAAISSSAGSASSSEGESEKEDTVGKVDDNRDDDDDSMDGASNIPVQKYRKMDESDSNSRLAIHKNDNKVQSYPGKKRGRKPNALKLLLEESNNNNTLLRMNSDSSTVSRSLGRDMSRDVHDLGGDKKMDNVHTVGSVDGGDMGADTVAPIRRRRGRPSALSRRLGRDKVMNPSLGSSLSSNMLDTDGIGTPEFNNNSNNMMHNLDGNGSSLLSSSYSNKSTEFLNNNNNSNNINMNNNFIRSEKKTVLNNSNNISRINESNHNSTIGSSSSDMIKDVVKRAYKQKSNQMTTNELIPPLTTGTSIPYSINARKNSEKVPIRKVFSRREDIDRAIVALNVANQLMSVTSAVTTASSSTNISSKTHSNNMNSTSSSASLENQEGVFTPRNHTVGLGGGVGAEQWIPSSTTMAICLDVVESIGEKQCQNYIEITQAIATKKRMEIEIQRQKQLQLQSQDQLRQRHTSHILAQGQGQGQVPSQKHQKQSSAQQQPSTQQSNKLMKEDTDVNASKSKNEKLDTISHEMIVQSTAIGTVISSNAVIHQSNYTKSDVQQTILKNENSSMYTTTIKQEKIDQAQAVINNNLSQNNHTTTNSIKLETYAQGPKDEADDALYDIIRSVLDRIIGVLEGSSADMTDNIPSGCVTENICMDVEPLLDGSDVTEDNINSKNVTKASFPPVVSEDKIAKDTVHSAEVCDEVEMTADQPQVAVEMTSFPLSNITTNMPDSIRKQEEIPTDNLIILSKSSNEHMNIMNEKKYPMSNHWKRRKLSQKDSEQTHILDKNTLKKDTVSYEMDISIYDFDSNTRWRCDNWNKNKSLMNEKALQKLYALIEDIKQENLESKKSNIYLLPTVGSGAYGVQSVRNTNPNNNGNNNNIQSNATNNNRDVRLFPNGGNHITVLYTEPYAAPCWVNNEKQMYQIRSKVMEEIRRRKMSTKKAWVELGNRYNYIKYNWEQYLIMSKKDTNNNNLYDDDEFENNQQHDGPRLRGLGSMRLISGNRYPARMTTARGLTDILNFSCDIDGQAQRALLAKTFCRRISGGAAPSIDLHSPWVGPDLHSSPIPTILSLPGCDMNVILNRSDDENGTELRQLLTSFGPTDFPNVVHDIMNVVDVHGNRLTTDGRQQKCRYKSLQEPCDIQCNCARNLDRIERLNRPWTDIEKCIFVDKFVQYPKNFSKIASYLKNRNTQDCIKFYYDSKAVLSFKSLLREFESRRRTGKPIWSQAIRVAKSVGGAMYLTSDPTYTFKEPVIELPTDDCTYRTRLSHPPYMSVALGVRKSHAVSQTSASSSFTNNNLPGPNSDNPTTTHILSSQIYNTSNSNNYYSEDFEESIPYQLNKLRAEIAIENLKNRMGDNSSDEDDDDNEKSEDDNHESNRVTEGSGRGWRGGRWGGRWGRGRGRGSRGGYRGRGNIDRRFRQSSIDGEDKSDGGDSSSSGDDGKGGLRRVIRRPGRGRGRGPRGGTGRGRGGGRWGRRVRMEEPNNDVDEEEDEESEEDESEDEGDTRERTDAAVDEEEDTEYPNDTVDGEEEDEVEEDENGNESISTKKKSLKRRREVIDEDNDVAYDYEGEGEGEGDPDEYGGEEEGDEEEEVGEDAGEEEGEADYDGEYDDGDVEETDANDGDAYVDSMVDGEGEDEGEGEDDIDEDENREQMIKDAPSLNSNITTSNSSNDLPIKSKKRKIDETDILEHSIQEDLIQLKEKKILSDHVTDTSTDITSDHHRNNSNNNDANEEQRQNE